MVSNAPKGDSFRSFELSRVVFGLIMSKFSNSDLIQWPEFLYLARKSRWRDELYASKFIYLFIFHIEVVGVEEAFRICN